MCTALTHQRSRRRVVLRAAPFLIAASDKSSANRKQNRSFRKRENECDVLLLDESEVFFKNVRALQSAYLEATGKGAIPSSRRVSSIASIATWEAGCRNQLLGSEGLYIMGSLQNPPCLAIALSRRSIMRDAVGDIVNFVEVFNAPCTYRTRSPLPTRITVGLIWYSTVPVSFV